MSLQVPSLSLSNPLPPVLSKQPSVSEPPRDELNTSHSCALGRASAKQDPVEQERKEPDQKCEKTVLILHTRDVSSDEEQLCRKFGVIRHFNPSMVNIPLETVEADYIFCDVRNKYYRIQIAKIDTEKFRVCALVNAWEKCNNVFDNFVDEINIMSKLPHDVKVAFKQEYDDLLCSKKLIKSPGNSCLSLMSYLVNIWDELKRK